jgi:hypothetical protein
MALPVHVTGFRLSHEVSDRVDLLLAELRRKNPGLKLTRSDAMRAALEKGLPKAKASQP